MERKHNASLTPHAKELRKNMTPHERRLWHTFLKSYPIRFLRQKIIANYIADFYCAKAKLIIEVDGSQHFEADAFEYDKERTTIINQYGFQVLRFSYYDIDRSFSEVCEMIDNTVRDRMMIES